jgi:hypothetical protein
MASLSAYYPLPVVAGTTAGTYAEGDDAAFKVGSDDIEITNPTKGIIFRDSNGVRHRFRAGTEGQLIEEIVP